MGLVFRKISACGERGALISAIAVVPDAGRAMSGGADGTLRAWSIDTGECLRTWTVHRDRVTSIAFDDDGQRAVTASWDRTVMRLDLESGDATPLSPRLRLNRPWMLIGTAAARLLVARSYDDKFASVVSLDTGEVVAGLGAPAEGMLTFARHPDGHRLLSGGWRGAVMLWDLRGPRHLWTERHHHSDVTALCIHPDGHTAASGDHAGQIALFDLESGRLLGMFAAHERGQGAPRAAVLPIDGAVTHLAFEPSAGRLVSTGLDGRVRIWDVGSRRCQGEATAGSALTAAAVAARGRVAGDYRTHLQSPPQEVWIAFGDADGGVHFLAFGASAVATPRGGPLGP